MGGIFNLTNANLYHYAGNHPVRYTDPDGRFDIILRGTDEDKKNLCSYINKYSYYRYIIGPEGSRLVREGNKKNVFFGIGKSKSYSEAINKIIVCNKNTTVSVNLYLGNDYTKVNPNMEEDSDIRSNSNGGITVPYPDGHIDVMISPDGGKKIEYKDGTIKNSKSPQEVLLHELTAHASPICSRQNGNGVENENKCRREANLKQRKEEPWHNCYDE